MRTTRPFINQGESMRKWIQYLTSFWKWFPSCHYYEMHDGRCWRILYAVISGWKYDILKIELTRQEFDLPNL